VKQAFSLLATSTAFAVLVAPQQVHASPLTLGAPAPDFSLINSRGEFITLDALTSSKKWTVLYFFPGAFTSGCTLEARKFQQDLSQYRELNAQIVGVSVDAVEKNAEFCKKEGLDFFMLTDEVSSTVDSLMYIDKHSINNTHRFQKCIPQYAKKRGEVSKKFGTALSIPGFGTFSNRQTYIIDPSKNVRWVFVDVESHIPRHSTEVLEKLKELQKV
jgi:peroxiredoxin Q/BCP